MDPFFGLNVSPVLRSFASSSSRSNFSVLGLSAAQFSRATLTDLLLSSKCCIEETFRRDSFTACRASSQLIDLYFIGGKDFDISHVLSTILQCFFEEGLNFVRSRPRIVLILEEFGVSRK